MNSPPKSSSNRTAGACDAEIQQDGEFSGPLRLPLSRPEDFIADFNRIYSGLDLQIAPRRIERPEAVGDSGDAATTQPEAADTKGHEKTPGARLDTEGF